MSTPPQSPVPSFTEQLAIIQTGPLTYTSKLNPQRLGNGAPIAYGGCTASIAVHAAYKTLPSSNNDNSNLNFHLYSVLGSFHGPTRTDRLINCTVTPTRDTKTFATRRVVASQTQNDGTERTCLDCFVDFHVQEPAGASLFEYDAQPFGPFDPTSDPLDPTKTKSTREVLEDLLRKGEVTEAEAKIHRTRFGLAETYYDARHCTSGVSGQNMLGTAKNLVSTQDHLHITDKTSAEWFRIRDKLTGEDANMAALTFVMDGGLSYLPLSHDHKGFGDAGACSTLDFALRVLVGGDGVDMNEWHLRDRRGVGAGRGTGRTFGEARMWDRRGRLVAVESQTCICRAPPLRGEAAMSKKAKI